MTAAMMLLGLTILLRYCPTLPVSRWLAGCLVEVPARLLNHIRLGHWAIMALGVALLGFAVWFEMDEIRMLAAAAGPMGDLVMLASAIEWGGVAELAMAAVLSSSMLARWPIVQRLIVRRSARRAVGSHRPANDPGDSDGRRLAA